MPKQKRWSDRSPEYRARHNEKRNERRKRRMAEDLEYRAKYHAKRNEQRKRRMAEDPGYREKWKEAHRYKRAFDRDFVAWDGEGWNGRYMLLANSEGQYIYNERGLTTLECLEFLVSFGSRKNSVKNHVAYGFGYDVNMILADLPLLGSFGTLEQLHDWTYTKWKGYAIRYIPRKWLSVIRLRDRKRITIYDVLGFFQKPFVEALEEWKIDVPEIVRIGKAAREEFADWDPQRVIAYNAEECRLLVELMRRFRDAMREAGFVTSRFHGAGALAADWLKQVNASEYLGPVPAEVQRAATVAYFGGRIELAAWGRFDPMYHADINSAYPAAMAECPNLSLVRWKRLEFPAPKRTTSRDADFLEDILPFSLLDVSWDISESDHMRYGGIRSQWNPLPYRMPDGTILFPPRGRGYYYAVEVIAALRRFPARCFTWHGGYIAEWIEPAAEEEYYPFRKAIRRDYALRAQWKREGRAAQLPLKLGLNSLYGKFAQRPSLSQQWRWQQGEEKRKPPFQSTVLAGYITSRTRAMLSDAIALHPSIFCVMTDSIFSLEPLTGLDFGKGLGQWSLEEDVRGTFIGAGLCITYKADGTPIARKQRGFGGVEIPYERIMDEWLSGTWSVTPVTVRRFVGMGLALASPDCWRERHLQFVNMPREIEAVPAVGTAKRCPPLHDDYGDGIHWQVSRDIPDERVGILSEPYDPHLDLRSDGVVTEDERMLRIANECSEDTYDG